MSTIVIATVLAAFCAIILAQERKIEIVGWFPDRDNITTSYERIAEYMFAVDFSAFCQRHNIDERPIQDHDRASRSRCRQGQANLV